ncbi:MAG: hypothetical protein IKU44_04400 [Firmicutes bacterium]|nr:hypothetical protein [Bacillota bacterium]
MANRNTLHMNKLPAFKEFLVSEGYEILPTVDIYEVLRARGKDKKTVVVYKRNSAREHVSIMDKDMWLLRRFLRVVK